MQIIGKDNTIYNNTQLSAHLCAHCTLTQILRSFFNTKNNFFQFSAISILSFTAFNY